MLPGAQTPGFGPGLGLIRRRRSALFSVPREHVKYGVEIIAAVQDTVNAAKARARSPPQLTQLCYYHA